MKPPVLLRRFHHRNSRPLPMTAVLMDTTSATPSFSAVSRAPAPASRKSVRMKSSPKVVTSISRPAATPAATPATAASRFASCLRRCAAAGFRLVVTAPAQHRSFVRGLERFPERRIDLTEHVQWDTAFRVFHGHTRESHDRGSWRILVVDRDDRVVGAITARFFCGGVLREHQLLPTLLELTGPVFREHCELAIAEVVASTTRAGRTPAEVSDWSVAPGWHAPLVAVTLMRAMVALAAAFEAPVVMLAGDNRRGEVTRLMRLGCEPLGLDGRFCLPPFVNHRTGAWLRLLLVDASRFNARSRGTPAADLGLLRQHATIVSAA